MPKATCSIEGCATDARWLQMCVKHYTQNRRGRLGVATDPQAKLEARFWAKVDKTETCWNWTASKIKGHGRLTVDGRTVYAHRLSYEILVGPIPEDLEIDHQCRNRSCVNPEHLRPVTRKQNQENRAGVPSNNTSGARGVHWRKDIGRWQVLIRSTRLGQRIATPHHVGYFDDLAEAEAAAIAKRNELFTHNDLDRNAA